MKIKKLCLMLSAVMLLSAVPVPAYAATYAIVSNEDDKNSASYDIRYKEEDDKVTINVKDIILRYLSSHQSVTSVGKTELTFTLENTESSFVVNLDAGAYNFTLSNLPYNGQYIVTMRTDYIWKNNVAKTVGESKFNLRVFDIEEESKDYSKVVIETSNKSINDEFEYDYDDSVADKLPETTEKDAQDIIHKDYIDEQPDEDKDNTTTDTTIKNDDGEFSGTEDEVNDADAKEDAVATVEKPVVKNATLSNNVLTLKFTTKDKKRTGIQYRIYYKNGSKVYKVVDKKTKKLSFKVKNVKKNNVYYVQARTYTGSGDKVTYSKWSTKKYFIQQAKLKKVSKNNIAWQSIKGAKSYTVYAATKKNGKYYKIKTTTKRNLKFTKINKKPYKVAYVKVLVKGTNGTKSTSKICKLK